MAAMARKVLTAEQIADAHRFKQIWVRKKTALNLTQEKVCEHMGWSSQSSFSQYLNGKIALNLQAVVKLAKILQVLPEEISPVLTRDIKQSERRGVQDEAARYSNLTAMDRLQAMVDRGELSEHDVELLELLAIKFKGEKKQ
jgi:transcriptional regulator with XRE-family HTH domain